MKKQIALALGIGVLLTTNAMAAEGDVGVAFLGGIFGELFGGEGGGAAAGIISKVNMFCLLIAGFLTAWGMFKSVLMTAHDGEVMGKSMHSVWAPIKTILGIGLVVPLGSGYCVAQYLTAWMFMQGAAIASGAWEGFADLKSQSYSQEESYTPYVDKNEVYNLAKNMLDHLNCQAGHELAAGSLEGFNTKPVSSGDYSTTRSFGVAGVGGNACGAISGINGNTVGKGAAEISAGKIKDQLFIFDGKEINQKYLQAHAQAAMTMENTLRPLVLKAQKGELKTSDSALIEKAVDSYIGSIKNVSANNSSLGNAYSDVSKTASSSGWFSAGASYGQQVANGSANTSAASSVPQSTQPPSDAAVNTAEVANGKAAIDGAMSQGDKSIWQSIKDNASNAWQSTKEAASGAWDKAKNFASSVDPWGALNAACKSAANSLFEAISGGGSGNFIQAMGSLGTVMMSAGAIMVAAGAVLDLWFHGVSLAMISLGATMVMTGAMLKLVIPMIPFMIYTSAAVGVLATVCLTIFGIPLWAMMICSPNGEIERHATGVKKVIALAMKPPALVFGFICASSVFDGVSKYVASVFFAVAQSNSGANGVTLLLGALALIMAYVAFQAALMKAIFQWCGMFADLIDQFVDSSPTGLSQQHMGATAGAPQAAIGATQAGSQALAGSANSINVGGKEKDNSKKASNASSSTSLDKGASSGKAGEMQSKAEFQGGGSSSNEKGSSGKSGEMQSKADKGSEGSKNHQNSNGSWNTQNGSRPMDRGATLGGAASSYAKNAVNQIGATALGGSAGMENSGEIHGGMEFNKPNNPNNPRNQTNNTEDQQRDDPPPKLDEGDKK